VNGEYYAWFEDGSNGMPSSFEVYSRIAECFVSPVKDIENAFRLASEGSEYCDFLSGSEFAVIRELVEFVHYVINDLGNEPKDGASKTFFYCNMNTGKSFVWSHLVD
jgi:hypothetical protein